MTLPNFDKKRKPPTIYRGYSLGDAGLMLLVVIIAVITVALIYRAMEVLSWLPWQWFES
jgi:hypothetical protein